MTRQPGWVRLTLTDMQRGQVVREMFFGGDGAYCRSLVHVPAHAATISFQLFDGAWDCPTADIRKLPRSLASLCLVARSLPVLPRAIFGSPLGLIGRVRARLGRASLQTGAAPDYATWQRLYEAASDGAPAERGNAGALIVVVIDDPNAPCLARSTLRSLTEHGDGVAVRLVRNAAEWRDAVDHAGERAVALLQAGEYLAAGGLSRLIAALGRDDLVVYGDDDRCDAAGIREQPHFKPLLQRPLLWSFTLSGGLMAFRPGCLAGLPDAALGHADLIRFAACLRLFAAVRAPAIGRVQAIISHRHHDTARACPDAAETLLADHLAACGIAATIERADIGFRVMRQAAARPTVGIVIASACRSPHVLACLRQVLRATAYPIAELVVVVSDPELSRRQRRVIAAIERLPGVRLLRAPMPSFDYPAVNALGAASLSSDLLLLLNDDVAPIAPEWLGRMVAHLDDPDVGIVGARLLYGNGTVQHAGVVVGLAHLCEHNDRFRERGDPGPFGSVILDRDVSAVTGACLLIRRSLWERLDGLDRQFAIALNDVDLCLRARREGVRIVYAAGALLHHYESLSLGRHYAGARAAREATETQLLRQRWSAEMHDDPFYNRNLSLEIGREWQPAFPPRALSA